jgi:hypothetical protein
MTSLLSSSSFRRLKSESSSRSYCFFRRKTDFEQTEFRSEKKKKLV